MNVTKNLIGNFLFFSCCLVKGEEEEEQKNPKLRVGGGVGWVGGILFSCEEREWLWRFACDFISDFLGMLWDSWRVHYIWPFRSKFFGPEISAKQFPNLLHHVISNVIYLRSVTNTFFPSSNASLIINIRLIFIENYKVINKDY